MNYYDEIKDKIIKSEIYDRAKDYAKDRNKASTYYEIGKLLSLAGKQYGKSIIKKFSERLMIEVGKKYNERNLRYMRQLYEMILELKWNTLRSKLCWSHYREVLSLNNMDEIKYYLDECEYKNLTQRQLHELIKNNTYNRLSKETKDKLITKEQLNVVDLVPNPIVINANVLNDNLSEYALKQSIMNSLDDFLSQLGIGFTYVGNEYKIKIGNIYNYIDILLFNVEFNCYVVVELKTVKLKKEHIGQIEVYMNYINQHLRRFNQEKTIGIIICKRDNKYVIEYCSDKRIISREYEIV